MPLASSSLVTVRAIEEQVFGVTPAAGNPMTLRVTGESLDYGITKETSKEINSNRTVSSVTAVTASTSGNLSMELSYAAFDTFLRSVLQGAWSKYGTDGVGATFTADVTATTITASAAPAGADAFTNLKRGQFFRLDGAGLNAGKILRVSTTVDPTATVITLDSHTPGIVSAGETMAVQSSRLTHGKTQTSFSIERENGDVGVFTVYRGQTPSKLSVSIASGQLTTMTMDFMGKSGQAENFTQLPGVPLPPSDYDIHSGVSGATNAVWMDGAPLTGTYVKSITLDFDNTLRAQEAIGHLGAVGIGSGTINCTLTASIYFADKSLFDKFVANQNTSLVFASSDNDGNGYMFTVPRANISTFKSNASAKDQDQMADITFTALEDRSNPVPANRKLLFIDRFGDAA